MAGGLFALNYEFITEENLNAVTSGRVLLMAYIGGLGYFIGPIIGAVVLTLMNSLLSNYTELWMLYLGMMFVLTVLFLPRGFAGFIMMHQTAWLRGKLSSLFLPYLITGMPAIIFGGSILAAIEMLHHEGEPFGFLFINLDSGNTLHWLALTAFAAPRIMPAGVLSGSSMPPGKKRTGWVIRPKVVGLMSILSLHNVSKSFGKTEIIRGVNLDIQAGERHAIIGPNGAGKSTLFHLISGKYQLSSGRITFRDQEIQNRPPYEIARLGLARSFQVTNIFPRLSVFENVRCGMLWQQGLGYSFRHLLGRQAELNARAMHLLAEINLADRADFPAGELAYAQQRALELGVAIASGADLIMLDEPVAGMSLSEAEAAVSLIRKITEGKTLVMVEHDMNIVFDIADRISVLVYGEIIASDSPQAIRANPKVQEAYLGEAALADAGGNNA